MFQFREQVPNKYRLNVVLQSLPKFCGVNKFIYQLTAPFQIKSVLYIHWKLYCLIFLTFVANKNFHHINIYSSNLTHFCIMLLNETYEQVINDYMYLFITCCNLKEQTCTCSKKYQDQCAVYVHFIIYFEHMCLPNWKTLSFLSLLRTWLVFDGLSKQSIVHFKFIIFLTL